MKVIFYKNNSDNRVVNKQLTIIKELNITRKIEKSIFEPVIEIVKDKAINNCNYVYIEEFNRFYFVVDIMELDGNIYKITMKEDVLSSFKNSILNLKACVERQEFKRNTQIVDNELILQSNNNFICKTVGNPVIANYNIYLTTCGGVGNNV